VATEGHSPDGGEAAPSALEDGGVFNSWPALNLMFVFVILATVILEFGMHRLMTGAPDDLKSVVAELNKELALLGLVGFILNTVKDTGPSDWWVKHLHIFDWCHLCLFFVAIVSIVSQTLLHIIVRLHERRYRRFEAENREILRSGIRRPRSKLQLIFDLARFVFECDRRQYFSKHLFAELEPERERPRQPLAQAEEPSPEASSPWIPAVEYSESSKNGFDAQPMMGKWNASTGGYHQNHDTARDLNLELEIVGAGWIPTCEEPTNGPPKPGDTPVLEPASPTETTTPSEADLVRAPPIPAQRSEGKASTGVAEAPRLQDFSFAEYLIRCTRLQILDLARISWLSWATVLVVLALHQIPLVLLPNHWEHARVVYSIAPGVAILVVVLGIWGHTYWKYWRCLDGLMEVMMFHSRTMNKDETEVHQKLEALLASRLSPSLLFWRGRAVPAHPNPDDPEAARRSSGAPFDKAALQAHRMAMYQRSIYRKRVWRDPPDATRVLQVLLLFLGFYMCVFIFTVMSRGRFWRVDAGFVLSFVCGIGIPVLIYCFILPDTLFRRAILNSVGFRIDISVMRDLEREQKAKVAAFRRTANRRRVLRRLRAKLRILTAFQTDDWEVAIRRLRELPPQGKCISSPC
jgi:hypothetical protein